MIYIISPSSFIQIFASIDIFARLENSIDISARLENSIDISARLENSIDIYKNRHPSAPVPFKFLYRSIFLLDLKIRSIFLLDSKTRSIFPLENSIDIHIGYICTRISDTDHSLVFSYLSTGTSMVRCWFERTRMKGRWKGESRSFDENAVHRDLWRKRQGRARRSTTRF